jgi:hypothetical protein
MNALEAKALELSELAKGYGLEPTTDIRGDWFVCLTYNRSLHSEITFTDTGKVCVKSWERIGRKRESVALRHLDEVLRWAGEAKKTADEKRARKEADKFISDHFKIISVI